MIGPRGTTIADGHEMDLTHQTSPARAAQRCPASEAGFRLRLLSYARCNPGGSYTNALPDREGTLHACCMTSAAGDCLQGIGARSPDESITACNLGAGRSPGNRERALGQSVPVPLFPQSTAPPLHSFPSAWPLPIPAASLLLS